MFYRNFTAPLGIICLLLASCAYSVSFPRGCEVRGFGFNGPRLVFNETGKQSFFLIVNHGTSPIKMQRIETRDVFMSPPLTAQIEPSQWAAFASDVSNFNFECLSTTDDNVHAVSCSEVVEVCEYPRVRFALSNMGNYWVSINKTQQQVVDDAVQKGIYLKW